MGAVAGVILALVTGAMPGGWVASSAGEQAYVEHPVRGADSDPLTREHDRRGAWSPARRLREPRVFFAEDLPAVSGRVASRGALQDFGLAARFGGVAARIIASDVPLPPEEIDLARRPPEDVRVVRVRLAGVSF